jgi:hypothetical protein
MTDQPGGEPSRPAGTRGRRFRPREIELADGSRLVLGKDGTIDHVDARGIQDAPLDA